MVSEASHPLSALDDAFTEEAAESKVTLLSERTEIDGVINDKKWEASRGTMRMNLSPASTDFLHSNSADLSFDDFSSSDIPPSKTRDDITSLQISTALKKRVLEKASMSRSELGTESYVVKLLDKNDTLVGNSNATISKNGHIISKIDTVNSIQLTREDAKIKIDEFELKRVELDEQNWVDGNEEGGAGVKAFVSSRDFNSADHYFDQKESRRNAGSAIINPQRRINDDLIVRFRDRAAAQEEQYSNSSSSSKSYEDFLSFTAAPTIHGEGRTLSEELSSPTTASQHAMKGNAVRMLSKLWNRKSRSAV